MTTLRSHWRQPAADVAWVGEGWRDVVSDCHRSLIEHFPNHELINIQDRDGELDYFAVVEPGSHDHRAVAEALAPVLAAASTTCMWCGETGSKRSQRAEVLVLCDDCDRRFSDPPRPGFD
ncbi:MAG: hypothetical protein AAGA65_20220 [Actinomycetota bacterium]